MLRMRSIQEAQEAAPLQTMGCSFIVEISEVALNNFLVSKVILWTQAQDILSCCVALCGSPQLNHILV